MKTTGWELALNFNKEINKNISVFADVALSDYKSEITKWNNSSKLLSTYYDGYEIGQIWGLTSDRLLQADDVITNSGKTVNGIDYSKTMGGNFARSDPRPTRERLSLAVTGLSVRATFKRSRQADLAFARRKDHRTNSPERACGRSAR